MATELEAGQAIEDFLKKIEKKHNISFEEYSPAVRISGQYNSGNYIYELTQNKVCLMHFLGPHNDIKEETTITYQSDNNKEKLESDLTECFEKLWKRLRK